MRAGHDIGDDLGFRRIRQRRLEHAHDRSRARPEPDGFADHRGIAFKRRRPEAMSQDRRAGGVRPIVARSEQTAEHRMQPHDLEI